VTSSSTYTGALDGIDGLDDSPICTRVEPWTWKKAVYRPRSEIKRLFGRLKGFRRIFGRFDRLDFMFIVFIYFAPIVEGLR
jgi:hypothetical protein